MAATDTMGLQYPVRDRWGAYQALPIWVQELLDEAQRAHAWPTGIVGTDRTWTAFNVDVYGFDEQSGLVVVQARYAWKRGRYGYTNVHKDYYLIGHNEDGSVFSHPVPSPRRSRRAMDGPPENTVRWCRARIWDCDEDDLDHIIRQGDVALVPVQHLPAEAEPIEARTVVIRESHRVRAEQIYRVVSDDGRATYYTTGRVSLVHLRHQHPTVQVRKGGIFRVTAGRRIPVWGFTTPSAD